MRAHFPRGLTVVALLAAVAPLGAAAQSPLPTYAVGTVPVAPLALSAEFPISEKFRVEVGGLVAGQGTYGSNNPFEYLSMVVPAATLHYDGVPNLRLSAGFQEFLYQEVGAMNMPSWHEERLFARARFQQPRGAAALYELLQLDVRHFTDFGGTDRLVFRPRLRLGQGFNLDAVRIHSIVLYQELGLRFATGDYTDRAFDFVRAVLGYGWTTRRGSWAVLGLVGQVSLNPAGTRYDVLWGPVLVLTHRYGLKQASEEAPPSAPDVELQ